MKTKKIILTSGIGLFIILGILSFRPIFNPTLDDSEIINGEVLTIREVGKTLDISIRLKNDEHNYYINRGIESGLNPDELNKKLANKEITIYFAKHWTLLDPYGKSKHITRITHNGTIIYDEITE